MINIRETESMIDVEQGQGTDLSFIHNRLVLTPSVDQSYPPPPITTTSQQDQGPQGESNFSDGSEALFSMYLRRVKEEDSRMAESWKGYADGMLVFVSLRAPSHSSRIT